MFEASYFEMMTENSGKFYMQYVELKIHANFSITDIGTCKSFQCSLLDYLIPHPLAVVHCRLSASYLRGA
jgi:hypothetical protein